jgi:type I restriction enzyme, R subunit
MLQVREEVYFTKGRIIVRSKLVTRGKAKKTDFVLYYKPNIPIALIEAKDNNHSIGHGIQQGLDYLLNRSWTTWSATSEKCQQPK